MLLCELELRIGNYVVIVVKLIALKEPFILVGQEQMDGELPHRGSVPFLEKDGQYWGPPGDDETAIRELERLRRDGARFIAFVGPTFWWLEHYLGLAQYLRSSFCAVVENERVIVFDLRDCGPTCPRRARSQLKYGKRKEAAPRQLPANH